MWVPARLRGREVRGGGWSRADVFRRRLDAPSSRLCELPKSTWQADTAEPEQQTMYRNLAGRVGYLHESGRQHSGQRPHSRQRLLHRWTMTARGDGRRSRSAHWDTRACIAASLQAQRRTRTRSKVQLLETRQTCLIRGQEGGQRESPRPPGFFRTHHGLRAHTREISPDEAE